MTGYQRCLTVIEGGIADRVPAFTPVICSDVAGAILGREVHTGGPELWYAEAQACMAGDAAHAEFEAKLEDDLVALRRAMQQDVFRFEWRKTDRPVAQVDEFTFVYEHADGSQQTWRWDTEVMNYVRTADTADRPTPEDWPERAKRMQAALPGTLEHIREHAGVEHVRMQQRLGDEMLVVGGGSGLSIGYDEASLMACALEPGAVADILDCQLEANFVLADTLGRRGIKAVMGGGDLADNKGPMYSPAVFRELMLPRLKKMIARYTEAGVHYVWRTDGNIWPIADMIFGEAGTPGYGETDRDASMTLAEVRRRYPDVVVWGNVSGDKLRRQSADEVYDTCVAILDESQGRGYFHGCSNTILPRTPVENVYAMMRALVDFSGATR